MEEAATALAKKHTQLQEMQERAEMAEGKIDAIQTQLDAAMQLLGEMHDLYTTSCEAGSRIWHGGGGAGMKRPKHGKLRCSRSNVEHCGENYR